MIVTVQLLCCYIYWQVYYCENFNYFYMTFLSYTKRSINKTYSWKMWCCKLSNTKSFNASLTSFPVSNTILPSSSSPESLSESQSSSYRSPLSIQMLCKTHDATTVFVKVDVFCSIFFYNNLPL